MRLEQALQQQSREELNLNVNEEDQDLNVESKDSEKSEQFIERDSDKSIHQVASEIEFVDEESKYTKLHQFIEHRYRLKLLIEKAKQAKKASKNKTKIVKRKPKFTLPMIGIQSEQYDVQ